MAKKLTWQEAKKKMEKGQEDLTKLLNQKEVLETKIKQQEQSNRKAHADYLTLLASQSAKSDKEIEQWLLQGHPHRKEGDD
ncbi:UNVERIFIED_CONTAM: hypothetical protein KB579_03265 [Streptococcus canis]|uniref:hypothetical protein n=1 Tax=Streptococcus canis TaxID=1329 RepID=UPI0012F0F60B|nr:hypothetical protein [Streptococcus canis]QKG74515.1 hypothetical protein GE023_009665 [Streptococcus canis]QKG75374.1 hypothetical protein GE022_003565 [Streptococcus canis]GFE45361.1 hypothetical protein ScFU6_11300 [Streptococcus canis]